MTAPIFGIPMMKYGLCLDILRTKGLSLTPSQPGSQYVDGASWSEDSCELRFCRRTRGIIVRLRRPRDGRREAALRAGDGHLDVHLAPGAAAPRTRLGALHGDVDRRQDSFFPFK